MNRSYEQICANDSDVPSVSVQQTTVLYVCCCFFLFYDVAQGLCI